MPFVPDKPARGRFVPDAPPPPAAAPPPQQSALRRQLGLTARIGAETVGALPLMAMDAGVAGRNLVTGSDYEMPSAMYTRGLDQIFPKPQTLTEKGVNIAGNTLLGSRLPSPQLKAPTPARFASAVPVPKNPTQQAVAEIQAQGGAVPRSATIASPDTAAGAAVQRVVRAGRDVPSGEIATRGVTSKLNAQNRRAILKHAGIDGDRATPEVLNDARDRIGSVFESVYEANNLTVSPTQVNAAINQVQNNLPIAQGSREAVESATQRITEAFNNGGGNLTGRTAKELRAWLMARRETAFKGQAIDAAEAFDDLIEGLDDAVFDSQPPGAREAVAAARLQWRNFKAIEHATDRGLSGEISPRKLASHLSRSKYTKRAYAANEPGTLESLARAFDTLADKFPNSGTASRAASFAEPIAAFATGGGSLPASVANAATQRYLAGPAGPLAPSLQGAGSKAVVAGMKGLLGNYPYEDEL